jgi:DNA-binding LacI/PurR family transcriptional regulator
VVVKQAESGRTTIFEVAEAAGVSITTVSHVFSGKRRVHEKTRQRVLEAATLLAYNPSSAAKALATGRSYALALQVSFTGEALVLNSFFSALLPALALAAVGRGYSLSFVPPLEQGRSFIGPLLSEGRVDGAVLVDPQADDPFVDAVRAGGTPFVTISRLPDGSSPFWIDNDHARICKLASEHLRKGGYERTALLTIEADVAYMADYLAGFAAAFGDSARVVIAEEFSSRAATAAVTRALKSRTPPDAFFCIHDQLALAAGIAVERAGLRVGRDVGVLGVGDSLFAREAQPQLTSVAVFPERFAEPTIAMLDGLIRGETPDAPVVIPARLVPRSSTRH